MKDLKLADTGKAVGDHPEGSYGNQILLLCFHSKANKATNK